MPSTLDLPPEKPAESRYGHLLQPIKDLAQNWNIDIAQELTDYMDEVDRIAISFDDGVTTLNFAEAALLIQGSACIYSKKVEYLYALVYETLELLASKRRKLMKGKSSLGADGSDADVENAALGENDDDEDAELLSLDDLKESANIDLDDEGDDSLQHSGTATFAPRTPVALLPIDDHHLSHHDNGATAATNIVSLRGELLGHRSDYRMNTSTMHESGALLLDNADCSLINSQSLPTDIAMNQNGNMNDNDDDDDNNNYNNDLGGFASPSPHENTPTNNLNRTGVNPYAAHKMAHADSGVFESNPWAQLDAHTASTTTMRPFKKGKTSQLPARLLQEESTADEEDTSSSSTEMKKATTLTLLRRAPFQPLAHFLACELNHARALPRNPLLTPSTDEFAYLFWPEHKKRAKAQRDTKRNLIKSSQQQHQQQSKHQKKVSPQLLDSLFAATTDYDNDDGGFDHGHHHGNNDDDDEYDGQYPFGAGAFDGDLFPIELDMHAERVSAHAARAVAAAADDSVTYEDLVRRHIDRFMNTAEAYARETELSRRVKEWEERIRPELERQEHMAPFNIYDCGRSVLEQFSALHLEEGTDSAVIPAQTLFAETALEPETHTVDPHCVSRVFVSCLQLANAGNVDILVQASPSDPNHFDGVRLLSSHDIYDHLDQYRAPSLVH